MGGAVPDGGRDLKLGANSGKWLNVRDDAAYSAVNLWVLLPLSAVVWAGHMMVFHGVGLGFELCDRTGAFPTLGFAVIIRVNFSALFDLGH